MIPDLRVLHPEYLALLALLPLAWWLARRSLAGLSPWRRRVALTLRMAILGMLVLACARLQIPGTSDRVAVYFLYDWSDSVPASPPEFRGELLQYMESAAGSEQRRSDDLIGVIYFGGDATCETPPVAGPVSLDRQAVIDTAGTDIAGAMRLALSTFPPGTRRRVVLVTDGNQNRGDALAEIEAARAQGVRVDVLPIHYEHDREIAVEKLVVPETVQPGVPFKLTGVVRSTVDAEADVIVRRGTEQVKKIRTTLQRGRNVIPVGLRELSGNDDALAGVVDYRMEVLPVHADDDHVPQNNGADGFTRLLGPPTVLYLDGNIGTVDKYHPVLHETLMRELQLAARRSGEGVDIRLHLRSLSDIPPETALAGYDCIILDNVPAEALGGPRMEKIRSLVNDQGVGLVMIGGEQSYGAGHYLRTPIEEALPVEMDLKHKKVYPNGALAIILHTCEFADGNTWAKQITKAAIDTLGAHDQVGVLLWNWNGATSGHTWLFPLQPALDRGRLKRLVDGCDPGDMPDFDQTIRMAVTGLQQTKAAVRHIIVISDGDPSAPALDIKRSLLNDKSMTLSAIGIGTHSTPVVLQDLALKWGGGRYYDVTDPRRLPRIFIKESLVVKRSLLWEETFTPALGDVADTSFIEDLLQAGEAPPLHGYVATTAKQAADVPLVSTNENRDPVLAHWRYGLGQAVAWTSDAKNRWGRDWIGWDAYGAFWSNMIWRILRQQPANLRMNTEIEGERGRILVTALDDQGNPLSDLSLVAWISDPESQSLAPVRLRQTGVSTYEGDFGASKVGKYTIAIRKAPGSAGPDVAAYGGASVPFSAELEKLSEDEPLLRRMAEKGGGAFLDPQARESLDLFDRAALPEARDYRDLWRWLLIVAAILFPLDVFTRRVMIDWRAGARYVRNRLRALQGQPPVREERMQRLVDAKRDAVRERPRPEFLDRTVSSGDAPPVIASSTAPSERTKPESGPPQPQATTSPEEAVEDTYTSRLLKAKQRARKKTD